MHCTVIVLLVTNEAIVLLVTNEATTRLLNLVVDVP